MEKLIHMATSELFMPPESAWATPFARALRESRRTLAPFSLFWVAGLDAPAREALRTALALRGETAARPGDAWCEAPDGEVLVVLGATGASRAEAPLRRLEACLEALAAREDTLGAWWTWTWRDAETRPEVLLETLRATARPLSEGPAALALGAPTGAETRLQVWMNQFDDEPA